MRRVARCLIGLLFKKITGKWWTTTQSDLGKVAGLMAHTCSSKSTSQANFSWPSWRGGTAAFLRPFAAFLLHRHVHSTEEQASICCAPAFVQGMTPWGGTDWWSGRVGPATQVCPTHATRTYPVGKSYSGTTHLVGTVSTHVQDAPFCPKIEQQKCGCIFFIGISFHCFNYYEHSKTWPIFGVRLVHGCNLYMGGHGRSCTPSPGPPAGL